MGSEMCIRDSTCINCKRPFRKCTCKKEQSKSCSGETLNNYFEKKGKRGSGFTKIEGLLRNKKELRNLAAKLKKHCAVGGSVKNNNSLELQGDQKIRLTRISVIMKIGGIYRSMHQTLNFRLNI